MNRNFYISKNGTLKRKDNTIRFITDEGVKKDIPCEVTSDIYIFGETNINTKIINLLAQQKIFLHVYNYYGFYSGSFIPREQNVSGFLLVKQVEHYLDKEKRLNLAKKIIESASYNIYRNVRYYNSRNIDLGNVLKELKSLRNGIQASESISELMGIEGNIRKKYYESWNDIIKQDINFTKRVKRPPDNMINSLLSFANSLVYTTALSEIYKTQLNPTISYLHETGTKRYSLSLDLAEIFKPLLAERMIFSLLNKNMITEYDFDKESNFLYLKEHARKLILEEYDKRLQRTINHKELNKDVSYRYLFRLECYKLIKHLTDEKEYEAFKIWW
ncbi:MAG: type I-B CRISPR-associated endonuclease Cas1b [Eubacterium sp.]|nr:type I-B CRISPR-associated endonuclease Cas1b [Gallibacter sp.]MDY6038198.1 type I-B CRISPR-associated endonuclease Cas1b [Eubacterium sp.]